MKRLCLLAFLLSAPVLAEVPAPEAPPPPKPAEALVQRALVEPLAAKESEQSRFSRARLPPQARRVRILDEQARVDARGGKFLRFAIDARHGFDDEAEWRLAAITGCVYLARGEVYVQKGDEFRPAAFLLGKNRKPAAETICRDGSEVAQAR